VRAWQGALLRSVQQAVEIGHLRRDLEPEQLVFEMHGLILALHHDARFLRNPGAVERARAAFERLVENYRNPQLPQDHQAA
jgi:hypothetical protein